MVFGPSVSLLSEKAESPYMRIITPTEAIDFKKPVVTVGTFDGVHVGHAAVIASVLSHAKEIQGTSVVITFDPHPRKFIDGAHAPGLLTTLSEKCARFEALGLDVLVVVPFDESLRQLSPDAFVQRYLADWLHANHVIVGYDHGFGKDRQGGYDTMCTLGNRFGFQVTSVEPSVVGNGPISSTRIREALLSGRFDEAVSLLGGGFPVWGVVEKGDGRGTGLGFPTANVTVNPSEKLLPPLGVYAALVRLDQVFQAVVNVGHRPTFNGQHWTFEVHLLNFSGNLYGQMLQVELVHHMRDEYKFESKEALVGQINTDIKIAKHWFSQRHSQ